MVIMRLSVYLAVSIFEKVNFCAWKRIVDNCKIHHAKRIQPFLNLYKDYLTPTFLSTYSRNLNAVERVWGYLKKV